MPLAWSRDGIPQAEAIFGWTAADVDGTRPCRTSSFPERYRDAHSRGDAALSRHRRGRRPQQAYRARGDPSSGGTSSRSSSRLPPIRSRYGRVLQRVCPRHHRSQATEEALVDSEERFRTLAESLPQLVWTCGPDGYCDYLSRQWVDYTGRPADEQLGSGLGGSPSPRRPARAQAEWAAAVAARRPLRRGVPHPAIRRRLPLVQDPRRAAARRARPDRQMVRIQHRFRGLRSRARRGCSSHLERLHLLDQTTRAIGERHDLGSIFRVMLAHLEDHLGIDFGCVCLHDAGDRCAQVAAVGRAQPASRSRARSAGADAHRRSPQRAVARATRRARARA